ncbi:hypothetical protein [Methanoculleus sp. DTU007]|jgi:hypothetical protein|uniref:hypothetical protein n=1 Tax=Methanoculleus sp. DTU007 TaxID=1671626 RepID=UPI000A575464|nr:hypothetical protein [Methanoculleus sp. DTU007]
MTDVRIKASCTLVLLGVLALALIVPAAAQGTTPRVVQPGETIEVGGEPLVLDLVNLRNADTLNPITELRHYREDNPTKQIIRTIGVPKDGYFTINAHTLNGKYGRYFAFSKQDGLIQHSSITFVPAPTETPTGPVETSTTAMETPTGTERAQETATANPTQAPLPGVIAVIAIGILGLILATIRRE